MTELTAADIRRLLDELGRRLDDRGVHGSLYIVGGAAIALEFDSRRGPRCVSPHHRPADVAEVDDDAGV